MERREFFKLAGASAATLALGGALLACEADRSMPSEPETGDANSIVGSPAISFAESVDVLIVGSGIAGLSAAMDPAERGKTVLIVEKRDLLGGESFEANGVFHVSGTELQKRAGISKTSSDAWKERKAELEEEGDTDNLPFKQELLMAQVEWVDRASSDYKAAFADPKEYADAAGHESILLPKKGIGDMESIMAPIKEVLSGKGVSFTLGMTARSFIVDSGNKPAGMRFVSEKTGKAFDVKAKKIVIAAGGFCANQAMVDQNMPDQTHISNLSVHSTGDGIDLATSIGGQTADMDRSAPLISDVPQVSAWGLLGPIINLSPYGERFAREDQLGKTATECASQGLGFWWTVFDKQVFEGPLSRSVAMVTSKRKTRLVGPFDELDDLADAMRVPRNALEDAFDRYGKAVDAGKDADFGRMGNLKKIGGPYYAIKQFPARYKTLGGMVTNGSGELTGLAGTPLGNVYCCGSAAAGSANGLAACAAFGMIVGKAVADALDAASDQ